MDLTVDVGEYKLNLRVAAIIEHDNRILFHKNPKKEHYGIIGGRVKIGEDTISAIKREIYEELGKKIIVKNLYSVCENFFIVNNIKYHEILFIYKAEFENESDRAIIDRLYCIEEGKDLYYEWLSREDMKNNIIKPKLFIDTFLSGNDVSHLIQK